MKNEVSRGSQAHHVPHIGWPQIAPVRIAITVIVAPTGAAARAASAETWWRRTNQMRLATSIISQALIAISAEGTWTKRILTLAPCW